MTTTYQLLLVLRNGRGTAFWLLLDHQIDQFVQITEFRSDVLDALEAGPLRYSAREHVIEKETERINVRTMIHFLTRESLLRRRIGKVRKPLVPARVNDRM